MKTKVPPEGLLLPKHWFEGVDEVDISQERERIVITPARTVDPIFQLGKQPVAADVDDASERHDRYVTGS